MAGQSYRIVGRVVHRETGQGIGGLHVEAWDKDLIVDDLCGSATTGADGGFEIVFDESYFSELFLDRRPDLYFKVFFGGELVESTERTVLWNVQAGESALTIHVGGRPPSGAPKPPGEPHLLQATADFDPRGKLKLRRAPNPLENGTLGNVGPALEILGPGEFPLTILRLPFDSTHTVGIDPVSVRVFRWASGTLQPLWESGANVGQGFIWAKLRQPGIYVSIGLPLDKLVQEALRTMAADRRRSGLDSPSERTAITRRALRVLLGPPAESVDELRTFLARIESQTSLTGVSPRDAVPNQGGHFLGYRLPKDETIHEFRARLEKLEVPPGGLPEEALFYPPDALREGLPPWELPATLPWNGVDPRLLDRLDILRYIDGFWLPPWLFSQDWWMYQHDERHTGHASGLSDIRSTTVGALYRRSAVAVDGPVITKPSIVDGKIYIGSGKTGGAGGTLYKIDLATGTVEGTFATSGTAFYSWYQGVGGSPAVVGGRIYFTGVHGKVYCVDAATMTQVWVTNLKFADAPRKQPVNQPDADSWSGPLVVNGKVYVGCGEGESAPTYGFVFCLDAATGDVIWLFCTAKFTNRLAPGSENSPNVVPSSVAISDPLPAWATAAGFTIQPDQPLTRSTGCSVWSSCAYDSVLNRIYVGTGNSQYGPGFTGTSLPDKWYGSGLISLDANTGQFRAFFQPSVDDSYWPGDKDIDVPGSPTLFSHGGVRALAFGSKNGSFFLLDPDTLAPLAKRQLLPRVGGSGVPGDRGTGIPAVVPTGGTGENSYGVMGTPAVDWAGRLFSGLGGYNGMALDDPIGIDPTRTPFLRSLNWNTLLDAWATAVGPDGVARYTVPKPPMYTTLEVGLSSPAVCNDVVFVSTNKSGLYALDAATGLCLWSAPGLPAGQFALGPAVYGNYVVMGAGNTVYIYKLGPRWRDFIFLYERWMWWRWWPDPPPFGSRPGPDPGPEFGMRGTR